MTESWTHHDPSQEYSSHPKCARPCWDRPSQVSYSRSHAAGAASERVALHGSRVPDQATLCGGGSSGAHHLFHSMPVRGVDLLRLALVDTRCGASRLCRGCNFFPFALVNAQHGAARSWRRGAGFVVRPRCIGICVHPVARLLPKFISLRIATSPHKRGTRFFNRCVHKSPTSLIEKRKWVHTS